MPDGITTMLKGKLKLPDRLGNLVVDFEDRDDKIGGSSSVLASSEELEIILPNGLGFSRHKDDGDGLCCTEEKKTNEAAIFRASARPYKDRAGSVSAMAFIAADEKRSDFEYQVRYNIYTYLFTYLREVSGEILKFDFLRNSRMPLLFSSKTFLITDYPVLTDYLR